MQEVVSQAHTLYSYLVSGFHAKKSGKTGKKTGKKRGKKHHHAHSKTHHGRITSVAISSCGGWIVSGSADERVILWKKVLGEFYYEMSYSHEAAVHSVQLVTPLQGGELIITSSCSKAIYTSRYNSVLDKLAAPEYIHPLALGREPTHSLT